MEDHDTYLWVREEDKPEPEDCWQWIDGLLDNVYFWAPYFGIGLAGLIGWAIYSN